MPNTLAAPPVRDLLDRLFQAAGHDDDRRAVSYVRDPARGYVSVAFPESDGVEISCRT